MADSAVTFLLQYLPEVLAQEANFLGGVENQVQSLERELRLINIFLEHSQGKWNEHAIVREVVSKIRDLAHEAHDVIDTFILNVAKHKKRSTAGKMLYSVTHANMLHDVAMKIEAINKEINKIYNRERYDIKRTDQARVDAAAEALRRRRREVEEDNVVGFTDDLAKLEEKLTGGNPALDVISIIGMGGLGKTTLAKKIYNTPRVRTRFDCLVWVYVSQDFKMKQLLVEILKGIPVSDELRRRLKYLSENELKKKLSEYLQGKKYFVVTDDIWSTQAWNEVISIFPDEFNGSRILITSRNKNVALDARHTSDPYLLPFLDQNQSWELLRRKVFRGGDCPPELETLGRQMAKGCSGLPLSIVVLGGLLAKQEKTHQTWSKLFGDVNLYLSDCKDILALSYTHLPRHLKPCFLYLGLYPEDFEIPVKKLINLWVAEGFIRVTGNIDLMNFAEDYLEELIDRSLVQMASVTTNGRAKTCRIHDLLRDFCISESAEEKFLEVCDVKHLSAHSSRRLSIQGGIDPYISSNPSHPTFVRSLLFLGRDTNDFDPNHWKWVLENFKLVRVLGFGRVNLYSVPVSIGRLIHLRYLRIESVALKAIPASIGNLTELETLDLSGTCLDCLPKGIWKLHRLRNLYMSGPVSLPHDIVPGIKPLNLQVLSTVSLNPQTVWPIVKSMLPYVRKLGIWFTSEESICEVVSVLESLCHLHYLQTLKIINYSQDAFLISLPLTITKITLRQVCLEDCHGIREMGKLPNLEILKLQSCSFSSELHVFANSFPFLEVLQLENLRIEEWKQEKCAMPELRHLIIKQCIELTMVPKELLRLLASVEVLWSNLELAKMLEELQPSQVQVGFKLLIDPPLDADFYKHTVA